MYFLMPGAYKRKIDDLLRYSGSKKSGRHFTNKTFLLSIILAASISFVFMGSFLTVFLITFIAVFIMFHGFLILAVDKRTKFIERILPDALHLMAANIKSGFIPSRAMLLSARKEFGPLSEGIKRAGKEMMTGKSFQESLHEITRNIKSDILENTVDLIIKGTRAGGQLVSLFEETAIDLRSRQSIRKEVKASILMYGIFIGFAACVGAPVLYALSSFLVGTISGLGAMVQIPQEFQNRASIMSFGAVNISQDFLFLFSVTAIVITTIFGGMIIGIIDSGKEKTGFKYIPVMLTMGLVSFFVARIIVSGIFGTLIPG